MKSRIAATLFALFSLNSAHATILTNGDFERGAAGWSMSGNVDDATQSGQGFYHGGGSVAENGKGAIVFNSGNTAATGQLWQSFATIVGTSYTLTFDYGSTTLLPQALVWSIFGKSAQVALTSGKVVDTNWSGLLDTYTVDFIANSATTKLLFADASSIFSIGTDGLLDNVSVTSHAVPAVVPEPGSLALLVLGGAALCKRRRKTLSPSLS